MSKMQTEIDKQNQALEEDDEAVEETQSTASEPSRGYRTLSAGFWILFVIIVAMIVYGGMAYSQSWWPFTVETNINQSEDDVFCAQVITPARNPETGEIRDFPTPCDVPEGWEVVDQPVTE